MKKKHVNDGIDQSSLTLLILMNVAFFFRKIKQINILAIIGAITALTSCTDSMYANDRDVEKVMFNDIALALDNGQNKINLNHVFGYSWQKICILMPYTLKHGFESLANEKVLNYKILKDDGLNLIWLFKNNGKQEALTVSRFMHTERGKENNLCTTSNNPWLFIKLENNRTFFYFEKLKG